MLFSLKVTFAFQPEFLSLMESVQFCLTDSAGKYTVSSDRISLTGEEVCFRETS